MKKRKTTLFLAAGVCLILLGVALLLLQQLRMHRGNERSFQVAAKIEALLPERTLGVPGGDTGMPVLQIDGTDYAALLEIPSFGLTLPVADRWDSGKLHFGPARFYGSAYDGSLIIGGADDPGQFEFCGRIEQGAQVILTDMTGARFTYSVSKVGRAKHADAQWLTEGDWDLTLFVQDVYAMEYIAVRCTLAGSQ